MQGPILIVDDSATVANLLKATLSRLGVEDVHWASSAAEGLAAFRQLEPTVVFMDIQLPDAGGDVIGQEMMQHKPDLKLVIITGMSREDRRVRDVVSLGAYDVLEKPLRVDRLRQLIALIDAEAKNLRRVS